MTGYWNNSSATAQSLRDGWLFTGDLRLMPEDGLLTLNDRSKDLIISGGSNIYPREVEEVILLHPKVLEVSVVGRKHADWGEEVVAFVLPRDGANIDTAELDQVAWITSRASSGPSTTSRSTRFPRITMARS